MKRLFGAAMLAALAAVVALLAAACADEEKPSGGVLLATTNTDLRSELPGAPIRIIDLAIGQTRTIGEASRYVYVRWSPDGSRLAALELAGEDRDIRLDIWDAGGKDLNNVTFPQGLAAAPMALAWSPDSTRLAALGSSAIWLFDPDGKQISMVRATPLTQGPGGSAPGGGLVWAPDSNHAAIEANGLLLVAGRDGERAELDLPTLPSSADGRPQSQTYLGWADASTVRLYARGDLDPREYRGTLRGDQIEWRDYGPFDMTSLVGDETLRQSVEGLVPGQGYSSSRKSADGSAGLVFLSTDRARGPGPMSGSVLVKLGAQSSLVDLGQNFLPMESSSDVVVIGEFSGALEPSIPGPPPLATATPDTGVRPNPPPEPTPGPEQSPVPFPDPRGEHVDAKVGGLPLYPGAVEEDGWIVHDGEFEKAVQQYATDATPAAVLAYYQAELAKQGYHMSGSGYGVQGEQDDYSNGRDRVLVSTVYIPRPEDQLPEGAPPYGFRGKGLSYFPGGDGQTWFFIVTVHAR